MIRIICVGKLKEKYFNEACLEYLKRLKKYTKIELIEVQDEGKDDISFVLSREKERILKVLNPKDYLITLEIEGETFSSVEFSKRLELLEMNHPNITFLIGGSFGIDSEILTHANMRLSFSSMTFPHQLFRIMLLEQIYRAYKIKNRETYHK